MIRMTLLWPLFLFCAVSVAEESTTCSKKDPDCLKVGTWTVSVAIGAGLRENPVAGRDDIPLVVLPSVNYHGKRFSIDNLNLSYLLTEKKRYSLNLVAMPSLEYMFFNDFSLGSISLEGGSVNASPAQAPREGGDTSVGDAGGRENFEQPPELDEDMLSSRNLVVLAGLDYGLYAGPLYFGMQALQDLSQVHDGQELRFAASYQSKFDGHLIRASAGALWKSDETMDYYYGLDASEVNDARLVYQARSGVAYFAKVNWTKKLSDKWSLLAAVYIRQMSDQANDSPLVDKRLIGTAYVGGVYHF